MEDREEGRTGSEPEPMGSQGPEAWLEQPGRGLSFLQKKGYLQLIPPDWRQGKLDVRSTL
jgi:hypothetical protein